jgi:hypothetical protein
VEKPWLKDFEEDLAKWRPLWEKHYDEGVPKNFEYPDYPLKWWFNWLFHINSSTNFHFWAAAIPT